MWDDAVLCTEPFPRIAFLHTHRGANMPRKNTRSQKKELWEKAKWEGFVPVRLTKTEKSAVKDDLLDEGAAYQWLMDVASDGYKVSISYSIPEDVYTVSLTGVYERKPNGGLTMSLRHRELIVAVTALRFAATEDGMIFDWDGRWDVGGSDNW
jgi:hypothetical protein